MALTNRTGAVRRVQLEHEPGEWIDVRPLSWRQAEEALRIAHTAKLRELTGMGDALLGAMEMAKDLPGEIMAASAAEAAGAEAVYDTATLLRHGVVAWSYPEPVTAETLDELDPITVQAIVAELLPRPLSEADRKNATSASTAPSTATDLLPIAG